MIKSKVISKRLVEIKEILKASKQIKQGYFYTGKLKDIIKKRKGMH